MTYYGKLFGIDVWLATKETHYLKAIGNLLNRKSPEPTLQALLKSWYNKIISSLIK